MTKQVLVGTCLIAAWTVQTTEAGGRIKVWSAEISKLVGEIREPAPEPVWGLAFSSDETQLAIGFGQQWTSDPRISRGHVIVVAIDQTRRVLHQFSVDDSPAFAVPGNIEWSPSGKVLVITPSRLFTLDGERSCSLPDDGQVFSGFLNEDQIVTYQRWNGTASSATEIRVYRSNCSIEDSWHPADDWTGVWGTCPQANLLGLRTISSTRRDQETEITVMSYPDRKSVRHWTWNPNATLGGITLADSCKLVCSGQLHKTWKDGYAGCWDIQNGEKVAENPSLTVTDLPAFNGDGGTLIAATIYKWACLDNRFWVFLDMNGCAARPKRRILWDVRTGREISSWSIEEQTIQMPGKAHKSVSAPSALALSPTGKYIAEAGSGRIELYTTPDRTIAGAR